MALDIRNPRIPRRLTVAIAGLVAMGSAASGATVPRGFRAQMSGDQVVPPHPTQATGIATANYDEVSHEMVIFVKVTGIAAKTVEVRHGAAGTNGPVLLKLSKTGTGWGGKVTLSPSQYFDLGGSRLYVSGTTSVLGGATLRGQLHPNVFGLDHAPVGQAQLVSTPDGLRVGNLGTAGQDGVRVELGEAEGYEFAASPFGSGRMRTKVVMSTAGGVLEEIEVEKEVDIASVPLAQACTIDLGGIGATKLLVSGRDASGKEVYSAVLPNAQPWMIPLTPPALDDVSYSVLLDEDVTPPGIDPYKNFKFVVRFEAGVKTVVFPGGATIAGLASVDARPANATTQVVAMTRCIHTAEGTPEFIISDAAVSAFGRSHRAVGSAMFVPSGGGLGLANLSAGGGADGVRVSTGDALVHEFMQSVKMDDAPMPWKIIAARPMKSGGGVAGPPLLTVVLERDDVAPVKAYVNDLDGSTFPDTSPRVSVHAKGVLVGELKGFVAGGGGNSVELVAASGGSPSPVGFRATTRSANSGGLPAVVAAAIMDVPTTFRLDGAELVGDELRFEFKSSAAASDVAMEELVLSVETIDTGSMEPASLDIVAEIGVACPSAAFSAYGAGCKGAGGFVPQLAMGGCATANGTVVFAISQGLGGTVGYLLVGSAEGTVPVGDGCSLLTAPQPPGLIGPFLLSGTGAGNGAFGLSAKLPKGTAPGHLTLQAALLDLASPAGLVLSNGVHVAVE